MELKNNVLFYVKQHLGTANSIFFYQACKLLFSESQIGAAKRLLLETCMSDLTEISPDTEKKVNVARNNTANRSKFDMEINDISSIISAFSLSDRDLTIIKNESETTTYLDVIPEEINPFALLDKVTEQKDEIEKLKSSNTELYNKHNALETELNNFKNLILFLSRANGYPAFPSEVTPTVPTASSSSPPPSSHVPQPSSPSPAHTPTNIATISPIGPRRALSLNDLSKIPTGESLSVIDSTTRNKVNKNERKKSTKPPSGKHRHEMNVASAKASSEATLDAVERGVDRATAVEMGGVAAAATIKTYASMISKSNGNPVPGAVTPPPRPGSGIVQRPGPRAQPTPLPSQTREHNTASTRIGETNARPSRYKRGTAQPQSRSIAAKITRPSHLENKCLVVTRLDRDTTKEDLISYVNEIANKEVNIKYLQDITRKDFTKWRTIVLELSPEDYTILSDESIWDSYMGISEFSG